MSGHVALLVSGQSSVYVCVPFIRAHRCQAFGYTLHLQNETHTESVSTVGPATMHTLSMALHTSPGCCCAHHIANFAFSFDLRDHLHTGPNIRLCEFLLVYDDRNFACRDSCR